MPNPPVPSPSPDDQPIASEIPTKSSPFPAHSADEPCLDESLDDLDATLEFYRGLPGRRRKAAVVLIALWGSTVALHLVSWGMWFVWGLATLFGIQMVRMVLAVPRSHPETLSTTEPDDLPFVSLLVAAKNEEAVIASIVQTLCQIDYPTQRYEVWVVDDHSTDRTPQVLDRLQQDYPQLRVLRRSAEATGGKSGALNQVVSLAQGDVVAVFDADAHVPHDLLQRVIPLFDNACVGAVQVRKAIAQAGLRMRSSNLWIRGQATEMALDSYLQQQRIAIRGISELRGNGQFVRRTALQQCGGWNEETITDDLDLTLRLHLARWDIDFLLIPPVGEEGVTRVGNLWHQRNRWAEGGYQRYLDYWRLLARNRMGTGKTLDMMTFFFMQYLVPQAMVPDFLMAIARSRLPLLTPITTITFSVACLGMYVGLRRIQYAQMKTMPGAIANPRWRTVIQAIQGNLYMLHWVLVISTMAFRIAIRPKRLKWVKTTHHGSDDSWLNLPDPLKPSK